MALNITFANGKTYEVLDSTLVYPSGSSNVRSRMEIHMAEDVMDLDAFVALMSNENATMTQKHVKIDADGKVLYDYTYTYFIVVSEVGKKRVDVVNNTTGAVSSEYHLVATLEQLTYTEQKLRELGIM